MTVFYTDGACKNNGRYGFQKAYRCVTDGDGKVLVDEYIGDKTNIQAEGLALIACFEHVYRNKITDAVIYTDSKFWVNTIIGGWKLKKPHLFPLRDRLQKGYKIIKPKLVWIPREKCKAGWYLEKKYEKHWNIPGRN